MTVPAERSAQFLALHQPGAPLVMANPWDVGSARVLASIGFAALATTSSGFAATLGRRDGGVTRDEAIAHGAAVADAVEVPVSADLEQGFADAPDAVADTVRRAAATGLAGCSVEDYSGGRDGTIYEVALAVERVTAAVEAAHADGRGFVITARAENLIRGRDDLADTIARLQAFEAAGADVLFAPGLRTIEDVTAVVGAVGRPVNVLLSAGMTVADLAAAGAGRISVGGSLSYVAMAAAGAAARTLLETGTFDVGEQIAAGRALAVDAFT